MGKKRKSPQDLLNAARKKAEAEKREAAKAKRLMPKRGELPAKRVMDIIADSLHQAVTEVFDGLEQAGANTQASRPDATLKGRCMYYAAAGQYVAEEFVGREYWVQVGSLVFKTDSEHEARIDATQGGVEARNFHMWLGTEDGGVDERIDFTTRFFKEWAEKSGATWDREDLPPYVWGEKTELWERLGVRFFPVIAAEPEADRQIQANEAVIDLIVERAKDLVKKRLNS